MSQSSATPEEPKEQGFDKLTIYFGIGAAVFFIIIGIIVCVGSGSSNSSQTTTRNTKEAYDKVMLMTVTEDYVKNYLVSPSTADFPRNQEWTISDNGSVITVNSYVDAENSFGGTVREYFTAKYDLPAVTLTYLEIDGKVMVDR
jgi:hypothetical protein